MRKYGLRAVKWVFKKYPAVRDLCGDASSELYYEEMAIKYANESPPHVSYIDGEEPETKENLS